MAAARLRCAAAIAIATAVPAAAALPLPLALRRHRAFRRVPAAAVCLRFSSCRIPAPPRRAAAAMSSLAAAAQRTEHEAGAWFAVPGLSLRDHRFAVPLDHSSPDRGDTITVFAREVVAGRSRLPASPRPTAIHRPCSVSAGPVVFARCMCGCVTLRFGRNWNDVEVCYLGSTDVID